MITCSRIHGNICLNGCVWHFLRPTKDQVSVTLNQQLCVIFGVKEAIQLYISNLHATGTTSFSATWLEIAVETVITKKFRLNKEAAIAASLVFATRGVVYVHTDEQTSIQPSKPVHW